MPDFAPKWQRSGESAHKRWTKRWTAVHRPPGHTNSPSRIPWRCMAVADFHGLQSCPVAVDDFEPASSVLREPQWKREIKKRPASECRLAFAFGTHRCHQSSSRRRAATSGNPLNAPTILPDARTSRTDLDSAIRQKTLLRNYLRPRLRLFGPAWIKSAILTAIKYGLREQGSLNLKSIAGQQGTGHIAIADSRPVGAAERKKESSKLYADFSGVLHKQG